MNKADLDEAGAVIHHAREQYRGAQMDVYYISARKESGLSELKERLQGEICCFSGQSGVGKSTLLNALFGLRVETGDISQRIMRGKNTTRHCELFSQAGMCVIDTPGFSLLEMDEVFDPVLLQGFYPEFAPYEGQCRFSPCYHASEPGCAVLSALKEGKIDEKRMERYHTLLAECRRVWRERYD